MRRHLPPLNALRAFEAAGRHENFSRAAEELGVSHSAISRHVRGLEHHLSTALFHDLPRGVTLTAAGRQYLAQTSAALDDIASATEALEGGVSGLLSVSCEPRFARAVLTPMLGDFYARFPEVELRLDSSRAVVDVERYEADVALRFAKTGTLDIPSDLVSNTPMYVFAAPELRPEGWHAPEALLSYRRFRDRGSKDVWQLWAQAAGLQGPEWSITGWRLRAELAYESALCGHGVYLGAADCAARDVAAGRLIRCFDTHICDGAIRLVVGAQAQRSKAARLFRNWLLENTTHLRRAEWRGEAV